MSGAAMNYDSNNSNASPLQLAVVLPSIKDVTTTSKQPDLPVDVLLVTVKDCEFCACYNELINPYRYYFKDVGYVYFNDVQSQEEIVKIALLRCNKGSTGPSSSLIAVKNAVPFLRPKVVISVGACSGLNPEKTKLGDVVVSAKLTTYVPKVATSDQEQWAGISSYVSRRFLNIITHCADGWEAPLKNPRERQISVHCNGEFLSGPEQIRAEWGRKELLDRHPLAAGVELEGEGVFTAAFDSQLEWLIVKGIADFANGEQATAGSWKACASVMAASLVSHILSDPGVFRSWPHFSAASSTEVNLSRRGEKEPLAGCLYSSRSSTPTRKGMATPQISQRTEAITQHYAEVPRIIEAIRQLYKRQERLVSFPWCDDLNFNLNDIFTQVRIVNRDKTRGTLTDDEITDMTAIFGPHPKCQQPRILLIEGEPGMGKTTVAQKLAHDWANQQDEWDASFPSIEVLLLLRCNDIKTDIWEAVNDQLLPDCIDEQAKENFFTFIRENQRKVLLVLDGLDEADSRKLDLYYSLVQSKLLAACHIVVTSGREVGKKARPYCDTLWEIVGFTKADTESFIRKYFEGKAHLAEKLIEVLRLEDDEHDNHDDYELLEGLRRLTNNPLHTAFLCCVFEHFEGVLPASRTQLYREIVLFVLRRYEEKNGLATSSEDLMSVYREELLLLGSLALESLLKGKFFLEKKEEIVKSINFGLLSFQQGCTKRKHRTRYVFLHKSFQEFFAGFYLASQIINKTTDCASVVADERYLDELRQVFLFMSGIVALRSEETVVSLVCGLSAPINSLLRKPDRDVRSYLQLACECISECSSVAGQLESRVVCTLGEHLDMSTVNTLTLWNSGIHSAGAAAISCALAANSSLMYLDLSDNSVGDAAIRCLSEVLATKSSLTHLYLSHTNIGDSGASSLSQVLAANFSLTTLDLSHNRIGHAGASALSNALTVNSSLRTLDFSYNRISDIGATCLAKALVVNVSLINLNLKNNSAGDSGAASLGQALSCNNSLITLDLSENCIAVAGASRLSQALTVNSSLTDLDLSHNSIGDAGASCLSQALTANSSLTDLDLSHNCIDDAGASCVSQALTANSSLTGLYLSHNSIGDVGASCLSQALTANSSLTGLYLSHNSIGDAGASSLSQALTANSSLTELYLSHNSIGVAGVSCLAQALTANSALMFLNLRNNAFGDAGAFGLSEAQKTNSSLIYLI